MRGAAHLARGLHHVRPHVANAMLHIADGWHDGIKHDGDERGEFPHLEEHEAGDEEDELRHGLQRIVDRPEEGRDPIAMGRPHAECAADCLEHVTKHQHAVVPGVLLRPLRVGHVICTQLCSYA